MRRMFRAFACLCEEGEEGVRQKLRRRVHEQGTQEGQCRKCDLISGIPEKGQ